MNNYKYLERNINYKNNIHIGLNAGLMIGNQCNYSRIKLLKSKLPLWISTYDYIPELSDVSDDVRE